MVCDHIQGSVSSTHLCERWGALGWRAQAISWHGQPRGPRPHRGQLHGTPRLGSPESLTQSGLQ